MWTLLVVLVLGCRNEEPTADDTAAAGLTPIGDVDAMAAAWCEMLSCRSGFHSAFLFKAQCVSVYSNYWGNPSQTNNQRACFEDIDEVSACVVALEAAECGGETPAACCALIQCQDPGDTEKEDTGSDICE